MNWEEILKNIQKQMEHQPSNTEKHHPKLDYTKSEIQDIMKQMLNSKESNQNKKNFLKAFYSFQKNLPKKEDMPAFVALGKSLLYNHHVFPHEEE